MKQYELKELSTLGSQTVKDIRRAGRRQQIAHSADGLAGVETECDEVTRCACGKRSSRNQLSP